MTQFNVELFHDVLNNEELAILNCLLECFLNVPEHQILQFSILCENSLEAIQVTLLYTVDKRATPRHELHETSLIVILHSLNLLPKPPIDKTNQSHSLKVKIVVSTYMR